MVVRVDFADRSHGWLLDRSTLYATADGGLNWPRVSPNVNLAGTRLDFIDPLHGWALGGDPAQPELLRTVDGGRTWEALPSAPAA